MNRRSLLQFGASLGVLGLPRYVWAQGKKVVSFWYEAATPQQQQALDDALVKPFDAAHPGEDLQILYRGEDVDKQLRIALLSGEGPDVVYTAGPGYVATMAQAHQLLPMTAYAKQYGWNDKIIPVLLQTGVYKGTLYALPKTYETMHLFYDEVLFARNGWQPPRTLAELDQLAAAMKGKGLVPFGAGNADWRGSNEWYVTLVLNNYAGPDAVAKALAGDLPWTDPLFVQAIDILKGWYQKGYFGQNYFSLTDEQAFASITNGKAGMSPNGTWAFGWVPTYFNDSSHKLGVVPFPTLRDGLAYPIYPLGIGSTLSINKNAQNADGAAQVFDMIFSKPFYDRITKTWSGDWNIPLVDRAGVDLAANTSLVYAQTVASLHGAVLKGQYGYTTWTFWPPATEEYMINGIEQVWLGKITTEAYLRKVDALFKREKREGRVPPLPAR